MRHVICALLGLAVFATLAAAQQPAPAPKPTVDQIVNYVGACETAERQITAGKLDAAEATLRRAIEGAPVASRMPSRFVPRGATARYLMARVHAARGDVDKAFGALADAAKNRFTDRDRVARDLAKTLRHDPRWGRALVAFPPAARYDRLSGKIVKDQRTGMGLIRMRAYNFPKLGERAPSLVRPTLDRKRNFDLAKYRGKRPVVLVLGSYT